MKKIFNLFKESAQELQNIRCLCVTAMLIALNMILKCTLSIKVTNELIISFAYIALATIGALYGPVTGFIAGSITDILGFMIKPTGPFDIRFTLIEAIAGMLYGLFLYRAKADKTLLPRIIGAKVSVMTICNLWLNTWFLLTYTSKSFLMLLPVRITKNLIQLPIDIFILYMCLPPILKAFKTYYLKRKNSLQ